MGLVAIVVLLFLQDWRAMILPMIDVPVSLIGTFAVMAAMGYSLNNISLFGLVLAIGIVVDDAIVVLENIERQMAKGLDTANRHDQGHGRNQRPDPGHHVGAVRGVCALCLHQWNHRPVFPPVRRDDRRFDDHFRRQRLDDDTFAGPRHLQEQRGPLSFGNRGESGHAHAHKPEALPWWIFGLLGGMLAVWFGPRLLASPLGILLPANRGGLMPIDELQTTTSVWLTRAAYFTPGLVVGLVLGWFIIRPVNAVLGLFFRGFNTAFDRMTAMYGWTIGHALRLSVVVLMVYGGSARLDLLHVPRCSNGLCPAARSGPAHCQRSAA